MWIIFQSITIKKDKQQSPKRAMLKAGDDQMDKRKRTNQ